MADQETLSLLLTKLAVDAADLKKGLQDGRNELQGFKTAAQGVGASVKKALAFAGVAVGIYEIASALKSFATEAAMVGARTETLEIAMQQVGKTYKVSASSLQLFVDELKGAGITTQESMTAVTKALTTGIPLTQLKDLATRARDIGVVAGINTSEALNRMMQGIISGEQETLRRLMIPVGSTDDIYKRFAATLGKTKEELNSVEKAQAMVNEVLRLSAGFAGIAEAADASVGKQLQSMTRFAEEAKNALWALFSPVMGAAVQEMTQGWKDLKTWADANQQSLKEWGVAFAGWMKDIAAATRSVVAFISENKNLIKTVLEIAIFAKASGWIIGLGKSLAGVMPQIAAATTALIGLKIACSGPWSIAITVAVGGIIYGINKIRELHNELANLQKNAGVSGRGPLTKPGGTFQVKQVPGISARGVISPELQAKLQEEGAIAQKARQEAIDANKKAQGESAKLGGGGKAGGGGKGAKESIDSLLAPMLAMYKVKREAELAEAQNSLDLLKSTNDKKRAELEKDLAENLIDGGTYYQRLRDLQQQETAATLAMIARKREAQKKAYQESLTEVEADTKLSEEAKSIARQKFEAENRKALAKLETEAAQVPLEAAKKLTDELRKQVELKKQYVLSTEQLNIETAQLMGGISEQEATLQKLVIDWREAKRKAFEAGTINPLSPAYVPGAEQALDQNLEAKKANTLYGGYASAITSGISSMVDALASGGVDLKNAANSMFKSLFNESLKSGLQQLQQQLVSGFQSLFGAAGGAVASAVMGVIGMVGMLLTSSKSASSFSASGVTSNVTGSEAVRGIIAGETSIPIAEISTSLQDAMVNTNSILSQIEVNTRGGGGGGGGGGEVNVNIQGIQEAVRSTIETYFREYLLTGARG